jgi:hypothetical protein
MKNTLRTLGVKIYNKILVIALVNLMVHIESKIQDLKLSFIHQFQNTTPSSSL